MSCARRERDLALLAGGDLPDRRGERLRAHLAQCRQCQETLAALRAQRASLAALRDEAFESAALAALQVRVLAGVEAQGRGRPLWRLAPLVVGICVVLAAVVVMLRRPTAPPAGRATNVPGARQQIASMTPTPPAPAVPASQPSALTVAPVPPPTPHRAVLARRPSSVAARVEAAPALSPEDADQLARAVVLVSQIKRVSDWPPAQPPRPPSDTGLVQLATDDPNVVIYWQIDSNGG
jgi:hypothetical protein